jgi:uncharacterized C2H2 Zn-finger protein
MNDIEEILTCPKCNGKLKCVRLDDEFVIKCLGCNTIFLDKKGYDLLWNKMKGKE